MTEAATTPQPIAIPQNPADRTDIITYAGEVSFQGYEAICQALNDKQDKAHHALLVLATPGGDPHAGFRIARALQHSYEHFDALVPRYCKSAGTLIVIGARKLYLDDMSELGPLDAQVKKGDELMGRNSGLDIIQAVNYMQNQTMIAFSQYLLEFTQRLGLSTKVASEISSRLTSGLFEPIAGQIDPMRLAEMQRALDIAFEYGRRLAEKSNNLRANGLRDLIVGYPSHGFVIDRKEAKRIFIEVHRPSALLSHISKLLHTEMAANTGAQVPVVNLYTFPKLDNGAVNDATPDAGGPSGSAPPSQPSGLGEAEGAAAPAEGAANDPQPDDPGQDSKPAA
ncbi:hypothetical protein J2X90_004833 [Variovorax paradoxus]|uniref:SDH family Clp fold serine proteinase n=1 Tax=Variovorax paradoxus TaxID=34073 RepID=UPI00278A484F|nr:hypothetical protein [Variovorax paradoxus]MDQ0027006.1 hypothetical protein [Variovorax paradoxus]